MCCISADVEVSERCCISADVKVSEQCVALVLTWRCQSSVLH